MGKKTKKNQSQLTDRDDQLKPKKLAETQVQQKKLIFRRRRMALILAVALVIFTLSGISLWKDHVELQSLEATKASDLKEKEKLAGSKEILEENVALLKDDEYVAKLARARYYWSKAGEQVYSLPTKDSSSSSEGSSSSTDSTESSAETTTSSAK